MTIRIFIAVFAALVVFSTIGAVAAILATNDAGVATTTTRVATTQVATAMP